MVKGCCATRWLRYPPVLLVNYEKFYFKILAGSFSSMSRVMLSRS